MKSVPYVTSGGQRPRAAPTSDAGSLTDIKCSGYSRSKIPQLPRWMEEFQEADVLWPWPDTPPPSPEEEGSYDYDLPAAAPELYEYDAAAVAFSCESFSEPAASWSWSASSSSTSLSALLSSDLSDDGGFFLCGPSTVSAAGLELGATEEFLEADVLWPDTADDAAEFLWRRSRRIEEAAASAAAAVFCGKREGCSRPLVASSPIDIPMATRGAAAARRCRP